MHNNFYRKVMYCVNLILRSPSSAPAADGTDGTLSSSAHYARLHEATPAVVGTFWNSLHSQVFVTTQPENVARNQGSLAKRLQILRDKRELRGCVMLNNEG
jgi:hypothetical protein